MSAFFIIANYFVMKSNCKFKFLFICGSYKLKLLLVIAFVAMKFEINNTSATLKMGKFYKTKLSPFSMQQEW